MRGEIKVVLEMKEAPSCEENASQLSSPTGSGIETGSTEEPLGRSNMPMETDTRGDYSTDPLAPADHYSGSILSQE